MGHFKEIGIWCINITCSRIGSEKGRLSIYYKILNDSISDFWNRTSFSAEPPFRRTSFSGSTVSNTSKHCQIYISINKYDQVLPSATCLGKPLKLQPFQWIELHVIVVFVKYCQILSFVVKYCCFLLF